MGSGAYSVLLFAGNSTVALPPPRSVGTVKFNDVFVSFASSVQIQVKAKVLTTTTPVDLGTINVGPGRTRSGHTFGPNDLAIHVEYTPPASNEVISALIEYTTP